MRPLRLRLKNFTAFREEQELDFDGLDLFALCGPIGSGKSSLLDAMTYALYGRVERVGDEPKYLVSQGQPRMAVTLDFRVGDVEARITRSTLSAGGSKVLLERRVDGEWQSFGAGADQVRTVNREILQLVGLDYDAFTRSVVLPQGKFAQFLVGDPLTRRRILTELLGLELFEKMAKRSNEIAADAKVTCETTEAILQRTFADATPEAFTQAKAGVVDAEARAASAEAAWQSITGLADIDREAQASIERGNSCIVALGQIRSWYDDHARVLAAANQRMGAMEERLAAARIEEEKAGDALEGARSDYEKTVAQWGGREQLLALRERVARHAEAIEELALAKESLATSEQELKTATNQSAAAAKGLARAKKASQNAAADLEQAKRKHDAAHRSDLVGALVVDLDVGAPCPICDRPLDSLPEVDASALREAVAALKLAETQHRSATEELGAAELAVAVSGQAVENAGAGVSRCRTEAGRREERARRIEAEIKPAFGNKMPRDAATVVERRLEEIDGLSSVLGEAERRFGAAVEALRDLQASSERANSEIEHLRLQMTESDARVSITAVLEQHRIEGGHGLRGVVPAEPPASLENYARSVVEETERLIDELTRRNKELEQERELLTERARTLLPNRAAPCAIDEAIRIAVEAAQEAREERSRLAVLVAKLKEDIAAKNQLEAEAKASRVDSELYRTLARELQKNRIVDYLQAEALEVLAAAASERLHELSGGRYVLAFENEGFSVVDGWNGEERRRVSTLSGGETFLASLALALALSEQVQLLAVTEQQRLESLFLDEGFGSLDPETLEVVVAAIEQLGGEDRLIGVITHVTEVAERLPARIEVVKSPRGSTLVTDRVPG
jgi:DNA repair protein SbcC/Rad50